jgi:periplasmic divalent cation tolerance protein
MRSVAVCIGLRQRLHCSDLSAQGADMSYRFVYMTAGSHEEARRIGRTLVEERLAACVNILTGMNSMYWWEGAVQDDEEAVLIAKTRTELLERLTERVRSLHSDQCPCVVALPIEGGNPAYLRWLGEETRNA